MLCLLKVSSNSVVNPTSTHIFLQTARFRQFWDEAAKSRHIVEAVSGITECFNPPLTHSVQ